MYSKDIPTAPSHFTFQKGTDLANLIYHVSGRRRELHTPLITFSAIAMYLCVLGMRVVTSSPGLQEAVRSSSVSCVSFWG